MGGVSHEGLWFEDTGGFDWDQNLELRSEVYSLEQK